jgi:hypothetical protein
MEFRDFEHRNWKKRLRGKLKTTNTGLIKVTGRSRRSHKTSRINRINSTPFKSSRYLRDFRLLPPARRGFRTSELLRGVYWDSLRMFHESPLRSISKGQRSKKNAENSWKWVQLEADKTCRHSMCEDLSAHRTDHFGRPTLTCQTSYSRFSKILAKFVGLRPTIIYKFFHPVNVDLGMNTLGAYSIPCECGQVYVGQIGRIIATRVKENYRHIRLGQPDKWAVPEHI